jgi:hypothetical protein
MNDELKFSVFAAMALCVPMAAWLLGFADSF